MIVEPRKDQLIWLDGAFVPWSEATMHVSDHHYGVGVFEGVRSYAVQDGAAVFRLEDHTSRLFRSARILGMNVPAQYDRDRLNQAQIELLLKNHLRDAYIRPFVFYGGTSGLSPRGQDLTVHVAILALEWREGAYHGSHAGTRGLTLRTAPTIRHTNGALYRAKANGNYLGSILALKEARAAGADDVVFLDQSGLLTEASGANVFVVRGHHIYTPPAATVLEGVTRDTIMKLATAMGWSVAERAITREDVWVADEAFLTGTASQVAAVGELDGRRIGGGATGPITSQLTAMYAAHVRGRGEYHPHWLTTI